MKPVRVLSGETGKRLNGHPTDGGQWPNGSSLDACSGETSDSAGPAPVGESFPGPLDGAAGFPLPRGVKKGSDLFLMKTDLSPFCLSFSQTGDRRCTEPDEQGSRQDAMVDLLFGSEEEPRQEDDEER